MSKKEVVRNVMEYDRAALSNATALICLDKSKTQQEFKDDADINLMVERFGIRHLPEGVRVPMYGDFTAVTDYRSGIHAVREAEYSFMQMSAQVRARFENDPQQFLDFCADPKNLAEMREMGLAVPEVKAAEPAAAAPGAAPGAAVAPVKGGV